jgi:hypothetical protein
MVMRGSKSRFLNLALSDYRVAWTKNALAAITVRFFPPEASGDKVDDDTGELLRNIQIGPNVRLDIKPTRAYKAISIELSGLTEPELKGLREIINLAFDLAEPVVKDRDAHAAKEDPNFSVNPRVHRALPEVAIRHGALEKHREGLRDGPEDAPSGSGGAVSTGNGVRGAGDLVVDSEPDGSGAEDDSATTD